MGFGRWMGIKRQEVCEDLEGSFVFNKLLTYIAPAMQEISPIKSWWVVEICPHESCGHNIMPS